MLKSIVENVNHPIVVCRKNGDFILWNKVAREMIGGEDNIKSTITWQKYYAAFKENGEMYSESNYPIMRAVLEGEVIKKERMYINNQSKGTQAYLDVDAFPIRDEKGEIVAGVASFTDVSKNVKMDKMLTDFIVTVEHLKKLISASFFT